MASSNYFDISYDQTKRGLLLIGDTHFENKAFQQGEDLIDRCVELAQEIDPYAIILLGDIQHTHETAKQSPFDQACRFIQKLSDISHVYIQIGNHDLINQSQFLSDKHFFNPLKRWENVTVVDVPTVFFVPTENEDVQVITCPYTPPGRLLEALDTLGTPIEANEEGIDWTASRCIFGHQEIRGVLYNDRPSTSGDAWLPSFPLFISGHIHDECNIGNNVMYTGSSRQVSISEDPNKKIWHVMFEDPKDDRYEEVYYDSDANPIVWIRKIELNIKGTIDIRLAYEDVKTFSFSTLETNYVTLRIKGTSEQFKIFKKSQLYAKMIRYGVDVRFDPNVDGKISPLNILIGDIPVESRKHGILSFETVFRLLIETKTEHVQEAYRELYDRKKVQTRMVFVGRDDLKNFRSPSDDKLIKSQKQYKK